MPAAHPERESEWVGEASVVRAGRRERRPSRKPSPGAASRSPARRQIEEGEGAGVLVAVDRAAGPGGVAPRAERPDLRAPALLHQRQDDLRAGRVSPLVDLAGEPPGARRERFDRVARAPA